MGAWVVHCIAKCQTCGKEWDNYKNAQAVAAKHAYKYGHVVEGEIGLAFRYGQEEKKPKP